MSVLGLDTDLKRKEETFQGNHLGLEKKIILLEPLWHWFLRLDQFCGF